MPPTDIIQGLGEHVLICLGACAVSLVITEGIDTSQIDLSIVHIIRSRPPM